MKIQLFVIYIFIITLVTFLRYFNDNLESVQVYHNRLLDYSWKHEQLDLYYCCLASIIRKNAKSIKIPLRENCIDFIYGYNYNDIPEIVGIIINENIIVFISTANLDDILSSLESQQKEIPQGMIHYGYDKRFQRIYNSLMKNLIKYRSSGCSDNLSDDRSDNRSSEQKLTLIGHSLGGVMASIAGFYLNLDFNFNVKVRTYGSPKWGNRQLKRFIETKENISITNYINTSDPVIYKPGNNYLRIGKTISGHIDTGNDNVNHGIKVYRELVVNNFDFKTKTRNHRFDEIISRKIMNMLT